jgi:chromosome partitioning protein
MLPEFLSMQSLGMLPRTVGVVRERLNPGLGSMAVVLTRFQKSRKLHREVLALTRGHFGERVCRSVIGENISLAEAPSFGQDIFRYKPDSAGARDYLCLAREILSRRTL